MNYHDVCFKAQAVGQTLNDADFFISYLVGSLLLSNIPIPSMYVFTYVYHKHQQNGGRKCQSHGWYRLWKTKARGKKITNLEHTGGKRPTSTTCPHGVLKNMERNFASHPKSRQKTHASSKNKSEVENTGIFYINKYKLTYNIWINICT